MRCNKCGAEIPYDGEVCPACGEQSVEIFENDVYKTRAKAVLKTRYWPAFAVSLIGYLLVNGFDVAYRIYRKWPGTAEHYIDPAQLQALLGIFSVIWILSIIFTLFVSNPIQTGSCRYFITAKCGGEKVSDIFYAFKSGRYIKIVGAMAWMNLFHLLWTLLFFIPGIVKYYAYCLTPYILAENPQIGYRRALKLSKQMTNGYKGDIFGLQLSFIGWYLLGMLCLGVGILFVNPYYYATFAEMYLSLKNNAIKKGICSEADFIEYNETGMQTY